MFSELDGFQYFIERGYDQMCRELEHNVCDAMLLNPGVRNSKDIELIANYLRKNFDEFKGLDHAFFLHLNFACRAFRRFVCKKEGKHGSEKLRNDGAAD